jgi:hypothetical protein
LLAKVGRQWFGGVSGWPNVGGRPVTREYE